MNDDENANLIANEPENDPNDKSKTNNNQPK